MTGAITKLKLPEKTVERLSSYRRTLLECLKLGKQQIYSYELAGMHSITAEQVRRDIMFIGYSNARKKGYNVPDLIEYIGTVLDDPKGLNVAIIGMGNLGSAIARYFVGKRPHLNIVAAFDIDASKTAKKISGIPCYLISELNTKVKELNIAIALLTVPVEHANNTAKLLVNAGIKGILNFTSVPLNVTPKVHIEEYDMITSIEKVAYYVRS